MIKFINKIITLHNDIKNIIIIINMMRYSYQAKKNNNLHIYNDDIFKIDYDYLKMY